MSSKPEQDRVAFLDDLRAHESGIDPKKHDWYVAHLHSPVLRYPEVTRPGRVLRDRSTGRHRLVPMTIAQYFTALGVYDLFDARDASCLQRMQYRSINAWGYVGYQVGEECLSDIGYYEMETCARDLPSGIAWVKRYHRGGIDPLLWADGRTEMWIEAEQIIATDVNCWRGRFTGKNAVSSFEDLRQPDAQEIIIREAAKSNLRQVIEALAAAGQGLRDFLVKEWTWAGQPVKCSLSGIIACCHLLGPQATARFLSSPGTMRDELGTELSDYMTRFGHYPTDGIIGPDFVDTA